MSCWRDRRPKKRAAQARLDEARLDAEVSQQRFTAAFTHGAVGMAIVAEDGTTIEVNRALCAMLGEHPAIHIGGRFDMAVEADDLPQLRKTLSALKADANAVVSVPLRCRRQDGTQLWVDLLCCRFEGPAPVGRCMIYQVTDVTLRHQAQQRLKHIVDHDSLTGLANRTSFTDRLAEAVERSRAPAGAGFAVVFLDLDRFKLVNDSLGHAAGNHLLCTSASRLQAVLDKGDLLARMGDDEFAILSTSADTAQKAFALAATIHATLGQPLAILGTEVVVGVSIGITLSDAGSRGADELLRDADLAMDEAKASGRGRTQMFDASIHTRSADLLALEAELRHAIGSGALHAEFQPIHRLGVQQQLAGFEALARWQHPARGPISPARFIALAEDSGHIVGLTRWMLREAVTQLARWRSDGFVAPATFVSVNISARDLGSPDLAAFVAELLRESGLPAANLTLEITETVLVTGLDAAVRALDALRRLGVKISIDDFGTGYASLAYLSSLPIDSLKIDRSFVMALHEKPQNAEIVGAVLNLGHALGMTVVAEGIETAAQLAALKHMGVDRGQGYLFSHPLTGAQMTRLLAEPLPR